MQRGESRDWELTVWIAKQNEGTTIRVLHVVHNFKVNEGLGDNGGHSDVANVSLQKACRTFSFSGLALSDMPGSPSLHIQS